MQSGQSDNIHVNRKKQATLGHALITVLCMAAFMFIAIVICGARPQIPLVLGCLVAGLVAKHLGCTWDEILAGMIEGINDSIEAILILLLIGMLVGAWIAAGTVPTLISCGLRLVSPALFLPATMLICLLVAFAIGSWGTVGTIGLAFMGIGLALDIPAPLAAGAIVSGAYMGEVISPLSDATNLTAAVVGDPVFRIVKRTIPAALLSGVLALLLFALRGISYAGVSAEAIRQSIDPLQASLAAQFHITPLALLPLVLIAACILAKLPAIPSMLFGALAGMAEAVLLQGRSLRDVLAFTYSGYVSSSGNAMLDELLSAGGMESMLESVSIILVAMAFGGIMKKTGQMEALIAPIIRRLHSAGSLRAVTVISCIFMNIVLPDQYLGISMPGQMYADAFEDRGLGKDELGATLLGGGAVTSPLIPWNSCGIYCMTVLGISPLRYAPFAFYGMILPVVTILLGKRKNT